MAALSHLSASQLQLYLTCSLKFRFTYIDKLPKLTKSANQVFGLAMHAALEWLHKELKHGRKVPLDELLRVYEADWQAQTLMGPAVVYGDGEGPDLFMVKGKELLSQYYVDYLPDGVQAAELRFQLPFINPDTGEVLPVPMLGFIDLIETDGTLVDFKNSARAMPTHDLPDNLQLTVYSWAYERLFGKSPKDIKLVNLVRTKTPKIETHLTGREASDYVRLFAIGKEVLKAVEYEVFVPNRGCWACSGCEFDQDCREWDGNGEVRSL